MSGDRAAQASGLDRSGQPLLRAVVLSKDAALTSAACTALVRSTVGCITIDDLPALLALLPGHPVDLVVCDDRALGRPMGAALTALRAAAPGARMVLLVDAQLATVAQDLPQRIADAVAWVRSGRESADDGGRLETVCGAILDAAQPMAALVVGNDGETRAANDVAIASGCVVGGLLPTLESFPLTTWSFAESQRGHRRFVEQAWRSAGRFEAAEPPTRLFALRSTRLPNGSYLMTGCEIADADDEVNDVVRVLSPREERLQALESFVGGVGRCFGELLGVVGGCAQLMELRFPRAKDDRGLDAIVTPLQGAVRQGMELIERLRSFARQAGIEREELDLVAVLRDWSRAVRAMAGHELQVEVSADRAHAPVSGNHKALHEALGELSANAVDALRQARVPNPLLRLRLLGERLADGREAVAIAIADNAGGIDIAAQERIFDPFFTTRSGTGHQGLGLSRVHNIASAHGGEVRVASVAGKGCDFRLVLPLLAARRGAADARPPLRVLMVGCDRLSLEVNACALRSLSCAVHTEPTGTSALRRLRPEQPADPRAEATPPPDALVIDADIGPEAAEALIRSARGLRPAPKVIVIAEGMARDGGGSGIDADRVLGKPCGAWDLHHALHHLIDGDRPSRDQPL